MTTIKELAESYSQRLVYAYDKRDEANKIVQEIKGLVYTNNNEPIRQEDKAFIANEIGRLIREQYAFKEAQNQAYLELIAYINSLLQMQKK